MIDLLPDDHARIRRVFRYKDDQAPVAPDLEALTDEAHQLTSTDPGGRQSQRRGPLVMVAAAVAVLALFGIGLVGSDPLSDPVDASATMQPGQGATAAVEVLLRSAIDGYVPDTGRHVATYLGPPGGPIEFYFFDQDTELAADGQPTRVIRSHCVGWGLSERGFNGSCGTLSLDPVAEPMVVGTDVVEADQSGHAVLLTPPDVVRVVIRFRSGTEITVEPANGISYATWDSGGFPANYEAIHRNGSLQEFK